MNLPVIVIGAGGHGRVVAEALRSAGHLVIGFLDLDPDLQQTTIDGIPVLGDDELLQTYSPETVHLANGIGSTGSTAARTKVYERLKRGGYIFQTVCHPTAIIAQSAQICSGAQIMAGAVIQPGVIVGDNTIINTGALVDHDCAIAAHAHISPGAVLCGGVRVDIGAHIGAGATVCQYVTLGERAVVGAGAVVIKDVPPGMVVIGVPAHSLRQSSQ